MRSSFARFAVRATVLTLVLGVAIYGVLVALRPHAALPVAAWASAIALAGALLGRAAGGLVPRERPEAPVQAATVASGVRLLASGALCFAALQAGIAPASAFVLAVGAQYLALLVLEVRQAVAEVRSAPVSAAAPQEDGSGAQR